MVDSFGDVLVLLKSTKDNFLGVDTPGQDASPRARCGTACLLIRNTIRSVSYSIE
jgi:hypothetical protein